jgi:type II restriction/modification system DNA methylase subunit YeeA
MNPLQFIQKWRGHSLTERSAAQQHFLDLCALVEHGTPAALDKTGEVFTFEKGVEKTGGGEGWADVWKRGYFGWEYKGLHKDLKVAYQQLLQYREALENPPLLVVSDTDVIEIHTNFTNTPTKVHSVPLEQLGEPESLRVLRAVFHEPEQLKPGVTNEAITAEAAQRIGDIAQRLRARGEEPHRVARFLDRMVFCLFAEDVELLPGKLFTRLVNDNRTAPERFTRLLKDLFRAMAVGGDFGAESIRYFNGNLFMEAVALELTTEELEALHDAAKLDWGAVDPSVFGTLFERGLDPDKRSQLGAHYTSRTDIETLVEPVVMAPLRREWADVQAGVRAQLERYERVTDPRTRKDALSSAQVALRAFGERLASVRILDPACGSGNFLYVALQKLLDLEKEVIVWGMEQKFPGRLPLVSPLQLHGIEINPYAFELAQMTVWIGYLQWSRANGWGEPAQPVLKPMHTFVEKDAILDLSDPDHPREPEWPATDFIIGNPPFLGNRLARGRLGDAYVEALFDLYGERLRTKPDLCCYWFERARAALENGTAQRVGLLATQGIRGSSNRHVLERIKKTGSIFFAISDRNWIIEGAAVHVSLIGFDRLQHDQVALNGQPVLSINADLTSGVDATEARPIRTNAGVAFQGGIKRGTFDLAESLALEMLHASGNPNGRPNSDVLLPFLNASDVTDRRPWTWIVDFGMRSERDSAQYEDPFAYVLEHVLPDRHGARQPEALERWWIHWRSRPELAKASAGLSRLLVTPRVGKHRLFAWFTPPVLLDNALVVFADDTDLFAGIVQSRPHEVWARRQGSQLRERESGFRYTPTTCFETFPFPHTTPDQLATIAAAAKSLDNLRNAWLNPAEWTRDGVVPPIVELGGSSSGRLRH